MKSYSSTFSMQVPIPHFSCLSYECPQALAWVVMVRVWYTYFLLTRVVHTQIFYMCKLICSQVAHLERSGHYLTVKDNQVSEVVFDLEDHTIRQTYFTCIAKYETNIRQNRLLE